MGENRRSPFKSDTIGLGRISRPGGHFDVTAQLHGPGWWRQAPRRRWLLWKRGWIAGWFFPYISVKRSTGQWLFKDRPVAHFCPWTAFRHADFDSRMAHAVA